MYRAVLVTLFPSVAVAAYALGSPWLAAGCNFVAPCASLDPFAKVFAIIAFVATFIGGVIGFLINRQRLSRVPSWLLFVVCLSIGGMLIFIYPHVPSWPFADIGLIVTWVFLCIALWSIAAYGASNVST